MTAKSLALLGLDKSEEQRVRALIDEVNERVQGSWTIVAEAEAAMLLIDFDSMYGQMSWLKAKSSGKPIIALTAAVRADADHLWKRPIDAESLLNILEGLAVDATGLPMVEAESAAIAVVASTIPVPTTEFEGAIVSAAEDPIPLALPTQTPAAPTEASTPDSETEPLPVNELKLVDFLRAEGWSGPVRLRDSAPMLVIDPAAKVFLGAATIKPLLPLTQKALTAEDWEALGADEYATVRSEVSGEQPLARLLWLAALGAGEGKLRGDLVGATRFKLNKYPQSEREFPRHFRIATAMLKKLATLDELATASGASTGEVADFVNACHALGIVEAEGLVAAPIESARGGLLGRLRGRK